MEKVLQEKIKKIRNKKIRKNDLGFEIIATTVLVLYCATLLGMLFWGFIVSISDIISFTLNPIGFPEQVRLENYIYAIQELKVEVTTNQGVVEFGFFGLLGNSFIYMIGPPIVSIFSTAMCAYVACFYPCSVTKFMHNLVIVLAVLPLMSSAGAGLYLKKIFGVYDNMFMSIITSAGFTGFNFLYYYSAFKGVSNSYMEAATLDGAGHFTIMIRINFPMVKNLTMGLLLMAFIGQWGDWMTPMLFLPSYPTIAYALYCFQFSTVNSVSSVTVQTAGTILVALPTLILFIVFRNKFVGNISLGGLKG